MLIQGGVEGYRGEPSELAARLGQAPRRVRLADPEAPQGRHVAVVARAARREAELQEEAPVLRGVGDEDEDAGRAVAGRVDADRGREAPGERDFRVLDAASSLEVASTRARRTPIAAPAVLLAALGGGDDERPDAEVAAAAVPPAMVAARGGDERERDRRAVRPRERSDEGPAALALDLAHVRPPQPRVRVRRREVREPRTRGGVARVADVVAVEPVDLRRGAGRVAARRAAAPRRRRRRAACRRRRRRRRREEPRESEV